jgi:hypothetical protein
MDLKVDSSKHGAANVFFKTKFKLLTAKFEFARQAVLLLVNDSPLVELAFKFLGKSLSWTKRYHSTSGNK